MITYETLIALPVGAIIGWIIREVVSDKLARDRTIDTIKTTEFNKASATFRASFVDIQFSLLKNIEDERRITTEIVTSDILAAHEKAKIMFEPFIESANLDSFNAAWLQYKNCQKNYFRDKKAFISGGGRKDESEYCLKHIYLLLDFAKPKINNSIYSKD